MARLFITPREHNFISDINKEIVKDVNGAAIFYYAISEIKTKTHDIYNEAIKKVFDNPIKIDAFVDAQFQRETRINQFGVDAVYNLEAFVQYRDLVDKNIKPSIGDFFSFSEIFYELTDIRVLKNNFGQAEHKNGLILVGTKARDQQFNAPIQGPTDIRYADEDAVQKTFVQQRGEAINSEGATGDKRDLHDVIDKPLTGPKEVSEKGAQSDESYHVSAFYDDEE